MNESRFQRSSLCACCYHCHPWPVTRAHWLSFLEKSAASEYKKSMILSSELLLTTVMWDKVRKFSESNKFIRELKNASDISY